MQNQISNKTVGRYYGHFRDLLVDCIGFNMDNKNQDEFMIGGPGIIVQIDESKFARRKYNRGRRVVSPWVLGGVEKTNERKIFLQTVEKKDAATLLGIIARQVKPGSIIITDCWKAYNLLPAFGYTHKTVNHSKQFIAPDCSETNSIEGSWTGIKMKIKPRQRNKDLIAPHLLEFIWRRENRSNLWEGAMDAIRTIRYNEPLNN